MTFGSWMEVVQCFFPYPVIYEGLSFPLEYCVKVFISVNCVCECFILLTKYDFSAWNIPLHEVFPSSVR
jgi:hypothetical protein